MEKLLKFNPKPILHQVFTRVRRDFQLGMSEYLDAVQAIEGGWGTTPKDLEELLRLLWCHSLAEQSLFQLIWESVSSDFSPTESVTPSSPLKPEKEPLRQSSSEKSSPSPPSPIRESAQPQSAVNLASAYFPVPFISPEARDIPELQTYYPISRRSMVYNWRYLRRPVADGSEDVLNVQATVELASRQGFFLRPVYSRRERNHAHLLLMLDQQGSMVPFHRFTRDLVETAVYESTIERVEVYYFHNVPGETVYLDLYLTEPIALQRILATCNQDTSVLIVSDGGAARGYRPLERIRATTEFLAKINQRTNLIAWLNPMSVKRWSGNSAQIIANLVPMLQMDNDGLSNAIDIVRGQPLHSYR